MLHAKSHEYATYSLSQEYSGDLYQQPCGSWEHASSPNSGVRRKRLKLEDSGAYTTQPGAQAASSQHYSISEKLHPESAKAWGQEQDAEGHNHNIGNGQHFQSLSVGVINESIAHFPTRTVGKSVTCQQSNHGQSFKRTINIETDILSNSIFEQAPTAFQPAFIEIGPDMVCYGLIPQFAQLNLNYSLPDELFPKWDRSNHLLYNLQKIANLDDRTINILTSLATGAGTVFEFKLKQNASSPILSKSRKRIDRAEMIPYTLSVVLYGSKDMADDIGDWLDSIEIYLQMPTYSSLDVTYHNPHNISSTAVINTFELISLTQKQKISSIRIHGDMYWDTFTVRNFREVQQPVLIQTPLHSHQKQAVTFMQDREHGWDLDDVRCTDDVWRCQVDSFGRDKFTDTFSGKSFFKPPTQFRGGVLADEMGLGKTCSMLALIASEHDLSYSLSTPNSPRTRTVGATLIVVPLPLLQVWENQINQHFHPNSMRTFTYHGNNRKQCTSLTGLDIILTTYSTVAREWKSRRRQKVAPTQLFEHPWHRIILDEAHIIKNKDTDIAKSVTALEGDRRWCITGTPIQNRSSDIYSLLRFLKVFPYNDIKQYEEVFVRPSKENANVAALQNLQRLMRVIAIRRPRAVVDLPLRDEITTHVMLSEAERYIYSEAKMRVMKVIDQAFDETDVNPGASYINALQRINELRYICNHGVTPVRKAKSVGNHSFEPHSGSIQQELDLLVAGNSDGLCQNCGSSLCDERLEEQSENYLSMGTDKRKRSNSQLCSNCSTASTSWLSQSGSLTPELSEVDSRASPTNEVRHISSKIYALVEAIQQTPSQDKSAIFSYWTSTLDLIGYALDASQISYVRYDGSMSRTKRDAVLKSFTTGPEKAILVSISCGGQGLDLTAANHAFLIEPQWNPMLEEQAMSRVHRLGQKKAVRLVRFVVKDTWEEKIVSLQEKKRMLAELIVDGPGENVEKLKGEEGRKKLALLRDLVA